MKLSYKWLQDFVQIPAKLNPEKLGDLITTRVVEVDEVVDESQLLHSVVVGEVVRIEKHPNADKLKICQVKVQKSKADLPAEASAQAGSRKPLQIVCGGSNVREGMKVALAKVGAKVRWHGQGEPVELRPVKIRGVESEGMICAADEIGLGDIFPKKEEKEILDLSKLETGNWKLETGASLAKALGLDDIIFDIDNKSLSSRPDLWGHYGMARELAALFKTKLKTYKVPKFKSGKDIKLRVAIQDKKACPRYTGVIVDGIKVGPSPEWLQRRLRSVGQRPINNIVDITNYVMFELAQPTHAFDVQKLTKNKEPATTAGRQGTNIVVRKAKEGEKFTTLDGVERKLTNEMLVIADPEKPLALAGVMGGLHTGVNDTTEAVLFESANFDAVTVRKMSQKLGLRTEGSARWEKWQDPENALIGLQRLVELTQKICPKARVVSNLIDTGPVKLTQGQISLSLSFVYKKIGMSIDKKRVMAILDDLGFGVKVKGDTLSVVIPTWRATKDISIPEDLVEEIARIYGYENIATTMPSFPIVPGKINPLRDLEHKVKELLAYEFAYTETYNYSFESPEWLARLKEDTKTHLELNNPIAKDRPFVREHLIPNLLMNVEANSHRFDRVALFEIGRVFWGKENGDFADNKKKEFLPKQPTLLGLVYAAKGEDQPYFRAAEAIKGVFDRLGVGLTFHKIESSYFVHPHRFAEMRIANKPIGLIGELNPELQERVGIPYRVAMVEVTLDDVVPLLGEHVRYQPVPKYPDVIRDVAFLIDRNIMHADVNREIKKADSLIVSTELFDIFDGRNLPAGKKSMAYHVVYRSLGRTLTAQEVDLAHGRVVAMLEKKFGAEIRK